MDGGGSYTHTSQYYIIFNLEVLHVLEKDYVLERRFKRHAGLVDEEGKRG